MKFDIIKEMGSSEPSQVNLDLSDKRTKAFIKHAIKHKVDNSKIIEGLIQQQPKAKELTLGTDHEAIYSFIHALDTTLDAIREYGWVPAKWAGIEKRQVRKLVIPNSIVRPA